MLSENVWNAVVIFREIQERGYNGGITILRDYIYPKRVLRVSRATVRFETEPGQQMQSDWGTIKTTVAGKTKNVHFIVNTLGYSRKFHFWCTDSQDSEHTYEGMALSFEHFGGSTQEVLVDNQKATVLSNIPGKNLVFNKKFVDFANHYGFTPKACRPYRARTKGKDERMVSYIKHHFFVRYRQFDSFAHLNQLALQWLSQEADKRVHRTLKEIVNNRFALEKATLCKLPIVKYDTSYFETRAVAWDGYIEVKGGRYSVPSDYIGKQVNIRIGLDGNLKIHYNDLIIAKHLLKKSNIWNTIDNHHKKLWDNTLRVQNRPLSVYEEASECN